MAVLFLNDFSGGLSNKFRQNRIADNESPNLRNARWSRFGALSKRPGTVRNLVTSGAGAAILPIRNLYVHQATNNLLILSALTSGGADIIIRTTSIGSYSNLVTTLANAPHSGEFITLNAFSYFTNGSDDVVSISESLALATPGGYPKAIFHATHKNYIFTFNANSTSTYSRLQWSDRNASTFTSTNFEDIYPNDGAEGAGIYSFGDELILFKRHFISGTQFTYDSSSMYSVVGNIFDATAGQYAIYKIPMPYGVGLVSHRSIQVLNGRLIFLTNDGFYAYDGGLKQPYPISEKIRGDIDNWGFSSLASFNDNPRVSSVVYKNKYYCSMVGNSSLISNADATPSTPQFNYVFDGNSWWRELVGIGTDSYGSSGFGALCWAIYNGNLYAGGGDPVGAGGIGILRQWEASGFTDTQGDGTTGNVNLSYSTKEYDFPVEQNFTQCFLHLRRQSSGTLTFEVNVDQTGVTTYLMDMTTPDTGSTQTSSSNILRKQILIGKHGKTIQFRFYDSGNNDVEIYAIELHHFNLNTPPVYST